MRRCSQLQSDMHSAAGFSVGNILLNDSVASNASEVSEVEGALRHRKFHGGLPYNKIMGVGLHGISCR